MNIKKIDPILTIVKEEIVLYIKEAYIEAVIPVHMQLEDNREPAEDEDEITYY